MPARKPRITTSIAFDLEVYEIAMELCTRYGVSLRKVVAIALREAAANTEREGYDDPDYTRAGVSKDE